MMMLFVRTALLLLIPPTIATFHELPTWPCPFNPLCSCSSVGANLGMVVCENVPMTSMPNGLNESKMFSISFRSNGMTTFEGNRFLGTGIWRAEISNNLITDLHLNALAGLEHSLHKLVLQKNQLLAVPTHALRNLLNLQQLDLSGNLIMDIQAVDFDDFGKSLVSLDLSDNVLNSIPNNAFQSLDDLQILDLTNNGIAALPETLFQSGPTHLGHFYIANNMLRNIPFATVSHLKHLHNLDLHHNLITTVFDVFFQGKLSVDTLNLDNNVIEGLPPYSFQNFGSINYTSLKGNNIYTIEDDAFKDARIQAINLGQCGISYISDRAFRGLENSLQILDLSQNNLTEIPALDNFDNLKNVSFQGNPISEISAEVFEIYPYTLQHLNLLGKEMGLVQSPTLAVMRNLRCLKMARISDTIISADFFRNFSPVMEDFALNHANVATIQDNSFQYIPSLKKLDLSDNSILAIAAGAFNEVGHSLENLILKNALQISRLPEESLEPLRNLRILDLRNNHINDLPFDSFHNMHDLKILNLQDNDIHKIEQRTFTGTNNPNLKVLHLSFNKLKSLESALFSGLEKLQALYLDDNQIETIAQHAFVHLSALEKLVLNGNAIVDIDSEAMLNLPRLRFLSLAYNSLTHFLLDSFDQVGSLTTLDIDLSHNLIQSLNANTSTYTGYSSIRTIDFSHNNISSVDYHYFEPIKTTLTHLNLKHNNLQYVTDTMFSELFQLQILDLSTNNISFIHNSALDSNYKLQILYLDNNDLTELPKDLFENHTSLRALYVSQNLIQDLSMDIFKMTVLEILDLSSNQLSRFPNASLSPIADHLQCLNISNNYLRFLGSNVLKAFTHLRILDLSHNLLTEIHKGTFDSLTKLVSLDLSYNLFQTLPDHTFNGLSQTLTHLYIANVTITSVPLLPLPHLVELDLSCNTITAIPPGALSNVSELRNLDLSDNLLTAMSTSVWHMLPQLYELRLNRNLIHTLTNSSFAGLNHLQKLQLLGNPLKVFQAGALKAMPALKSLHTDLYIEAKGFNLPNILSDNDVLTELLINIPYETLGSELSGNLPPHLKTLILTGLNLTSIASNAFHSIDGHLLRLAIHNTSMTTIPSFLLEQLGKVDILSLDVRDNQLTSLGTPSLSTSVTELLLGGNPWHCDCNIGWIEGWLRRQRQDDCPASDCSLLTRALRDAQCTNYQNRSMLDVLKTELDCGWPITSHAPTDKADFFPFCVILTILTAYVL